MNRATIMRRLRAQHLCYMICCARTARTRSSALAVAVAAPDNIWNTPVELPVLTNSSSMVTTIGAGTSFSVPGTWDGGPIGIPFAWSPERRLVSTFLYQGDRGPYRAVDR